MAVDKKVVIKTSIYKNQINSTMTIEKKAVIQRKPGYLYFIDGKGNVCSAPMKRKKKAAPKKVAAKKAKKATVKRKATTKKKAVKRK